MKVCFEEIGHFSATFEAGSGETGDLCKLSGNGEVAPCSDGEVFIGVMEGRRNRFTAVQLHGFITLPYSGSAPSLGYGEFVADGAGGVKTASGGRKCLVVQVDADKQVLTMEM